MNPSVACAEAPIWRQSRTRIRPPHPDTSNTANIYAEARNVGGIKMQMAPLSLNAQPGRVRMRERVVADCTGLPSPHYPSSSRPALPSPALPSWLSHALECRIANVSIVNFPTAKRNQHTPFHFHTPLLLLFQHSPFPTLTDATRVLHLGTQERERERERVGEWEATACGMGHVVPFVAISWALFLFFVCN